MKLNKILMIIAILLVLTLPSVLAFGITPGRTTIMYEDVDKEFFFTLLNSGEKEMDVEFSTSGELGKYIVLDEKKATISKDEEARIFRFTIDIDDEFEKPGVYEGKIIITETGAKEKGFGFAMTISKQVALRVTDSSVSLRGKTILVDREQSKEEVPVFEATLLMILLIGLILIIFKSLPRKK
jgi:hypothetical protein